MSNQTPPSVPPASPSPEDLQFDRADPAASDAAGPLCIGCQQPIVDQYYTAGDKVVCPQCRDGVLTMHTGGSRIARLFKATLYGIIAGLGGALIWWGVRHFTGYEVGLIAVVVGLMVGGAVRAGSSRRGGIGYQLLAVVLTYCSIAANYMPDVFKALMDDFENERGQAAQVSPATAPSSAVDVERGAAAEPDPAEHGNESRPGAGRTILAIAIVLVLVFAISLAAPFLAGLGNIIGLLIIGFALWEAWKLNKRANVTFAGPYSMAGLHATPAAPTM